MKAIAQSQGTLKSWNNALRASSPNINEVKEEELIIFYLRLKERQATNERLIKQFSENPQTHPCNLSQQEM
jgi:hypothetical protein